MGWFSNKPSTADIVQARHDAEEARNTVRYAKHSLETFGAGWSNQEVQEFRVEQHKAEQRLKEANEILKHQT